MAEVQRPILIAIISILEILSALAVIAIGIAMLAGMTFTEDADLQTFSGIGGAAIVVIGLLYFILGYGMFKGWRIMWYLGVIFNILGAIGGIVTFTIIPTIICAIILYYLFRPKVKAFFRV